MPFLQMLVPLEIFLMAFQNDAVIKQKSPSLPKLFLGNNFFFLCDINVIITFIRNVSNFVKVYFHRYGKY